MWRQGDGAGAAARLREALHRVRRVNDATAKSVQPEIAAKLVISQRTAASHVEHILTKLGLTNRVQVAAWIAAQRATNGS